MTYVPKTSSPSSANACSSTERSAGRPGLSNGVDATSAAGLSGLPSTADAVTESILSKSTAADCAALFDIASSLSSTPLFILPAFCCIEPPTPTDRPPAAAPLARVLHPDPYFPAHIRTTVSPVSPRGSLRVSPRSTSRAEFFDDRPTSRPQTSQTERPFGYPETARRYSPREENKHTVPSPVSPIHSAPRSSVSSFSSPRAPSISHITRPSITHRSDSGVSTAAISSSTHDSYSSYFPLPFAPDLSSGQNRYKLKIRQQPIAARACGQGERDRRTIDPPPILQLTLTDFDPDSPEDQAKLRWPMNIVHCALHSIPRRTSPVGRDVSSISDPNNSEKQSRRLMGTLVANPFIGIDPEIPTSAPENSRIGCFFIFHDLSCRQNGLYRLHFTLVSVNINELGTGGHMPTIATVDSDVFEVFSAKDFPGMRASSVLTRGLKLQGANVQVKKGSEGKVSTAAKKRVNTESDESAGDGTNDDRASPKPRKKRRKQ
ncbi:hypothetical protein MMC18_003341 [Xylographa bjoerkii]|nr:hypothetical protein [Xylographa bjoerkii]